jgi:hypothetical protein
MEVPEEKRPYGSQDFSDRSKVNYNFNSDDSDYEEGNPTKKKKGCSSYIIINRKGGFRSFLSVVNIFICTISSYAYIWTAVFGNDPDGFSNRMMWAFESLFLIMMLCNFVTDFTRDGEHVAVTDLEEIGVRYIQSDFLYDLVPLLPFSFFLDNSQYKFYRLFFCIKVLRVKTGFDSFNIGKMYTDVRDYYKDRIEIRIKNHPEIATDMINNHTDIYTQMIIGYLLKSLKLVIIIFNLSFFLGMFWLIYCEVTQYAFYDYYGE